MNFMRAIGFLTVGVVLGRLPQWAPTWFATAGVDGSSARMIWLQLMSWLQIAIASTYILSAMGKILVRLMRYEPRPVAETQTAWPARAWAQAAPVERLAVGRPVRKRKVLVRPVAFDSGAIEQPRAA